MFNDTTLPFFAKLAAALFSAAVITGCSLDLKKHDDDGEGSGGTIIIDDPDYPGDGDGYTYYSSSSEQCTQTSLTYSNYYNNWRSYSEYECKESEDFTWRTSCPDGSCRPLPVYVHYVLTEDLGSNQTIHVEAFDNEHFDGYPKGTLEVRNFKAKAGEWDDGEIFLEPGEYYLRAYLRTDDADPLPYNFDGMQLVAGEPVGVYGATSAAQKVSVSPEGVVDPVHITLDKLFEKPGSRPDTKARVRVSLTVAAEHQAAIPLQREIIVGFFSGDDFNADPIATFSVASEMLKVEGQVGTADLVSPSLTPGRYTMRVFVDSDGDGFIDAGELAAIYKLLDAPAMVEVKANHTEPVSLTLTPAE